MVGTNYEALAVTGENTPSEENTVMIVVNVSCRDVLSTEPNHSNHTQRSRKKPIANRFRMTNLFVIQDSPHPTVAAIKKNGENGGEVVLTRNPLGISMEATKLLPRLEIVPSTCLMIIFA
jgi:hypothetical protein